MVFFRRPPVLGISLREQTRKDYCLSALASYWSSVVWLTTQIFHNLEIPHERMKWFFFQGEEFFESWCIGGLVKQRPPPPLPLLTCTTQCLLCCPAQLPTAPDPAVVRALSHKQPWALGWPLPSLQLVSRAQEASAWIPSPQPSAQRDLGFSTIAELPAVSLPLPHPVLPSEGRHAEHEDYTFQPASSELGEHGKRRRKAIGILVYWSIN